MAMCGHAISQHAFLMLELATALRGRSFPAMDQEPESAEDVVVF
jgi:hypothetical protein